VEVLWARGLSPCVFLLLFCDVVRPILWSSPVAFLQWVAALVSGGLLCSDSLWAAVPLPLLCAESCVCCGVFAEEAASHTCCVEAASLYYTVVCMLRVPHPMLAVRIVCWGCRFMFAEGAAWYTELCVPRPISAVGFSFRVWVLDVLVPVILSLVARKFLLSLA